MKLGVLKPRWKRIFNGSKIIRIDLQLFVGDQFQKYVLEAWEAHDSEILYIHVQKSANLFLKKNTCLYL